MIRLKNIERKNNLVECNIIPEDSKAEGRLVVDLVKKDIASYTLPEGYEDCYGHVRHAVRAILQDAKEGSLPKERLVMWY